MGQNFGLGTAVAVGVGGIVGGGIYAAIGIVVGVAGYLTWLAYAIAGVVVLSTAYSYVNLNRLTDDEGGSVTFIEELTGQSTYAAIVGWTLIVGYIGTMAMYAYAFGAFAEFLIGRSYIFGISARPLISALIVVVFIALNLLGAGSSTSTERYLVVIQAGIIFVFGLIALGFGFTHNELRVGLSSITIDPLVAGAVSFVSFEGWQLLFYDQEQFEDPVETLAKGVFASIAAAAAIYILVGFVVPSLVPPAAVAAQPEAALNFAGLRISKWLALGITIAALVSTASAINSTMFSNAIFAKNLVSDGILPDKFSDTGHGNVPKRPVIIIGLLVIFVTVRGGLESIVEFASLTYIVVYGSVNVVALMKRDSDQISPIPPMIGLVGSAMFFVLLLRYLYLVKRPVFSAVVIIALVVFGIEAVYFERETIKESVEEAEEQV
ncbi:MAG TPA: APC family permease [Halococcus sp.]|nr:APC family permease [Halococcus sp.]